MIVLSIETSCDDTSLALIERKGKDFRIICHLKSSQEEILKKWGGVVPEIAARHHLSQLAILYRELKSRHSLEEIDFIAVTQLPGLLGPLLTGLNFAKTLSLLYRKPIMGVNHLHAHLEAIHLTESVSYPYLGLLVSGGHSLILKVDHDDFTILASTLDDAAGEAFDKGGKLLGLDYPAGRHIDALAKKGNKNALSFPIGLEGKISMSFSGIKASLQRFTLENSDFQDSLADICASYQEAIVKALNQKVKIASKLYPELPLVIGGGVACNSRLREVLRENFSQLHLVAPEFCQDNSAMIAAYALMHPHQTTSFPECLNMDAQSRFIDKREFRS